MGENLILTVFLLLPVACAAALAWLRHRLRRQDQPAAWPQVLLANVLLLFALIGLLCLGGEIYFRFFYDTTDSFAYSKVTQRWFERYWVQNQNGIRDNINYPLEIAPGKRRISFIGDSFTAGHGIKSVEDRFANILRRAHPEWEVHALAIPGYDTRAELALLSGLLERGYQLDLVVLVYCLNDISDLAPRQQEALRRISEESKGRPWILRRSYFFDVLSYRFSTRFNPDMRSYYDIVREAYRGELWETQQRRLMAFRDVVQSRRGRLAVVMFPFFHTLGTGYAYAAEHDQLQQFWRASGTPYLDLLSIYQQFSTEDLTVSLFDAHPNEKAHAMAASAMGDFLRQCLINSESASRLSADSPSTEPAGTRPTR